jgi:hypothetical protein
MFSFLIFFWYYVLFFYVKYMGCVLFFWDGCVVTKTRRAYVCLACRTYVHLALVLESLCCHQIYSHPMPTCIIEKQKRHSDCGCLKIWALIIIVLLSVMRVHPRYEFCGRLHVTYLVLVRILLHGPQRVLLVFMSIFLDSCHTLIFCTHGYSFKYSAFLTDVLHFSS